MIRRKQHARSRQAGFSMVELLIAVALLVIIMGTVMGQVTAIHKRSQAEASKLDVIQEARETMDQLTRDLHQAGYPSPAMYDANFISVANPNWYFDTHVALRLVAIGANWIFFEGDVDGSGNVSVVRYRISNLNIAESTHCPCLERMQSVKVAANPFLGQPVAYHVIAENLVANTGFAVSAFDQSGNPVPLGAGLNINNGNFPTLNGF